MRRVARQRDATYAFPSMPDRKGINWPHHWLSVSVSDHARMADARQSPSGSLAASNSVL
jgi:hypothetical protein